MEKQPIFKKSMFGGFDKKSVLDYIVELSDSTQEAQDKLNAQLEEVTAAREKLTEELREMGAKLDSAGRERANVDEELSSERRRTGELGELIDSLQDEIRKQERIVAEKDAEIEAHMQRTQELLDKNVKLEEKKDEVERASIYIGELLLRTRSDSEKILADAAKQAEELVAEASASLEDVYQEFRRFRKDMDGIQEQIESALSTVQTKFSTMSESVGSTEQALREFCYRPKTELKLVTDVDKKEDGASPAGDGNSSTFFRPAAESR